MHTCVRGLLSVLGLMIAPVAAGTIAADEVSLPSPTPEYPLSENAGRVGRMIDSQDFEAVQRLCDKLLDEDQQDAGLLCQYVKFLIMSRDPAYPNFIQSPLVRDGDYYWSVGFAGRAAEIAVGLDPGCKPYLADLMLASFAARVEQCLEEGRGFIGQGRVLFNVETGRPQYYTGISLSMVELCFDAIRFDPVGASRWVEPYERLTRRCVKLGKPASSMMLGNLTGDLVQGGEGPEDFRRANEAFLDSLTYFEPDPNYDWLEETANFYPNFRDEMLATQDGREVDPRFRELERKLSAEGISIPRASKENQYNLSAPTGVGTH